VPGASVSGAAGRWQVDPQQVYRWRHNEGVTHRRKMRRSHAAEPAFVPIVTDAMPAGEAAPTALATPVIEISLAGAVVRVVSGLDDAQLTTVLRAVRASVLRA
jgi:transposase